MTEQAAQPQTPAAETPGQGQQDSGNNGNGFSQEDVNKIAGTRAKEAKQAAINDLLQKAGAESVDDILAGYQGFKTVEEETKTEADRLKEQLGKLQPQAERAKQLEEFVTTYVQAQREGVPEYVTALLDNMDPLQQAAWLNEHKAELVAQPEQSQTPRRSPDASVRPAQSNDPQDQHASFLANLLNHAP